MILITGIAVEGQPVKEYLDEQLISAGGPLGLAAASSRSCSQQPSCREEQRSASSSAWRAELPR
jgi:hypothetical protein